MGVPPGAPAARRRGLTFTQLWVFLAVGVPFVVALSAPIYMNDAAFVVRSGQIMLGSHRLLSADPFTFTVGGHPWLNQQWGAEILFALGYRLGGWELLAFLRSVLTGLIFLLVFLSCKASGANTKPCAFITIASFLVAFTGFGVRPQLLGMALFALTSLIVAIRKTRPRLMWAVPVVTVIWANLHGSFFLAPLLLGLAWIQDRLDRRPQANRTLWLAVASAAATLVNPFGIKIWSYAFGLSTNPLVSKIISEWAPTTLRTPTGALFFVSIASVVVLFARRAPIQWPALLWAGVFLAIGLFTVRGVFWWALGMPPLLATIMAPDLPSPAADAPSLVAGAVAICLILVAALLLPWVRGSSPLIGAKNKSLLSEAPSGVTAELKRVLRPGQRVFSKAEWGSWFEFALPGHHVFVDSRVEVFPASVWTQYLQVSAGQQGWDEVLRRWHVSAVAISPVSQEALIRVLLKAPDWHLAYMGQDGYVFARV